MFYAGKNPSEERLLSENIGSVKDEAQILRLKNLDVGDDTDEGPKGVDCFLTQGPQNKLVIFFCTISGMSRLTYLFLGAMFNVCFILPFNKYLLSIYYVLDTLLDTRGIAMNKIDKNINPLEFIFWWEKYNKEISVLCIFGDRCYGESFAEKIGDIVLNRVVRENLMTF